MHWETAAKEMRDAIDQAIPQKWKLQDSQKENLEDVRNIPKTCGLLSQEDLDITQQSATDLVRKLAIGKLSSVRVVEAFCARAAIAHQLVRDRCAPSFSRFRLQRNIKGELPCCLLSRGSLEKSSRARRATQA